MNALGFETLTQNVLLPRGFREDPAKIGADRSRTHAESRMAPNANLV